MPKPRPPRNKRDKGGGSDGDPGTGGSGDSNATAKTAQPAAGSEFEPKPGDSAAVAEWRKRMASVQAREIYKERAATAECVHAQMRNHGLQRMPMRGRLKARASALLHALAHNLRRIFTLAPQMVRPPAPALRPSGCAA